MAAALRVSEALALDRLCSGGGAAALFGVSSRGVPLPALGVVEAPQRERKSQRRKTTFSPKICGPTGLAARAEHGKRWHRYLKVLKVLRLSTRFRGRVVMGAFLGRGASNMTRTRNASPRPALPPGPGLLPSCSLT
eukprot:scaffold13989_cov60-Phaeocystis_antarctica.AAC.3